VDLTLALVTDLHFGPRAHFEGKLRKLSELAPRLLEAFVRRMNDEVRPDVVVNLGDDIEDESAELDRRRYGEAMEILGRLNGSAVLHVAGNHDTVHLTPQQILDAWKHPAPASGSAQERVLYYSREIGGYHLVILHTHEVKDDSVYLDEPQLAWLANDLEQTALPVVVLMHHSAADQSLVGNRWFEGKPHICLVRERKRLREVLEASGKVLVVLNGHLHWNQLTVHRGIPYVTVQSLIENLDEDAPGRAADASAVVKISRARVLVEVCGEETARYQFARG